MQCKKCGTANRRRAKFCEECGAPLALACPACGTPVSTGKKFCGECGASLMQQSPVAHSQLSVVGSQLLAPHSQSPIRYTPSHLAHRILSGKTAMEGERKIVTVLFADIKGSMEIMETLDPEEAKELLDPCLQMMIEAVHRAEGTVNRLLGDGLMALFGAPLALEDHPQRALYAALRMHEAVKRYAAELSQHHNISLQIRVGINTGEVVVRTISNDLYMDYSAVGHVVGLAARMEALSTPGSTLVTTHTHRLAQDAFHFAARGSVKVKGVKEPVEVYELLGSHASHSRLAARASRGLAPFVGRSWELSELSALIDAARQGRGQVVALAGEAGVGKSRLLEEIKPTLRANGFLLIEGAGFAYGKTRAYLPLIEMLKRYCEITDQDSPTIYQEKLYQRLVAIDPTLADYVPVFLELLGVESPDPQIAALSGEAKLQKVLDGIKRLIASQSRHQPVALIIEDVHWLDSRSLLFLYALIAGIAALPVVFLLSYRPEQTYPWETFSFSHRLQIGPLPREASISLFTSLVGNDSQVVALAPLIWEQSSGNPFFLEEIVQSLIETGTLVGQPKAYTLAHPLTNWALPATVHGVLASRLDRLSLPVKTLLQTAAVIGREFSRSLLARVTPMSKVDLDHALSILQSREFLYETTASADTVYTFKHALTQEVAYHSLLRERRAELHAVVGAAVEALYEDKLAEYVTLLAHHYSLSANSEKALHYLQLAAERAFELYADSDALHFWTEHLRVLATLPASSDRDRQEVRTHLHLINVLARQNSDDGTLRAQFAAAEAACNKLNDHRLLAELHATLAVAYVLWGRPQPGLTHARRAKQLADALADLHLQIVTLGPLAHLLWIAGQFSAGLQVAEEGLALLRQHRLLDEQMDFIAYPYVQCLAIAGACKGFLGDFDQGLSMLQEAALSAKRHGNRIPEALSYWGRALLYALRGDASVAVSEAEKALALMQEVSSTTGIFLTGSLREYLTLVVDSPVPFPLSSSSWLLQTWQTQQAFCELAGTWLAAVEMRAGRPQDALRFAQEALARAEASDSLWFRCVAHATLGSIFGQAGQQEYAAAEAHLLQALSAAETMHSQPLCGQVLLAIGELLWKRQQDLSSQPADKHPNDYDSGTGQGTLLLDEKQRAREYLTRAAELCESLHMTTASRRARTLLGQVDASSRGFSGH
jgi:predicted ATPase/class 3 adenylate cyclase